MVITMRERIEQLKKEKDIVILAHYYVDGEVQEIADLVGDSYFLAKKATEVSQQNILFCGVSFMGESAKILNPGKRVIMALPKSSRCVNSIRMWQLSVMSIRRQRSRHIRTYV